MILHNGTLIEPHASEGSLLNRAFKYGDGLFESMRVLHGKPLLWESHMKRLSKGMQVLGLEAEPDFFGRLAKGSEQLIQVNDIGVFGRMRLTVYRGGAGSYMPTDNSAQYTLEVYSLKEDPGFNAPVSLCDYQQWQLSTGPLTGLKTLNALPYVMAARYARSKGYDDAVMYAQGKVSETSRANLFIVKNKRIITPPLSSCCLYGVMRRQLFKLCFELKVNIRESNLSQKDLLEADEMFLTNSVRGIIPVGSYLSRNYQPGYGPISGFLQQSMERFLLAEIV